MRVNTCFAALSVGLVVLTVSACGASKPVAPMPMPTRSGVVGPAEYQNSKIGLRVMLPWGIQADADVSSPAMKTLMTFLPKGSGGVNARIGGIVAFYPEYWTGTTEPGGYALAWRQPPLFTHKEYVRIRKPSMMRKIVDATVATGKSSYGPNVIAVATHVGPFPAVKETVRTTDSSGTSITVRWFWVYTPRAEYAFFGWTRTSRAKTWLWDFDKMNDSFTVNRY
jgi:hypothetical protein